MPSIIGAALVCAGCAGAGLLGYWRLHERVRLLHAFTMLMERLSAEIGLRLTPVQELSERLENEALKGFWGDIRENYCPLGEQSYAQVWRDAAGRLELAEIDRELIGELGAVLGQYDPEAQARSLELVRRQMEVSLGLAREQKLKQGRMYGVAGVLCGLLTVVLCM